MYNNLSLLLIWPLITDTVEIDAYLHKQQLLFPVATSVRGSCCTTQNKTEEINQVEPRVFPVGPHLTRLSFTPSAVMHHTLHCHISGQYCGFLLILIDPNWKFNYVCTFPLLLYLKQFSNVCFYCTECCELTCKTVFTDNVLYTPPFKSCFNF